MAFTWTELLDDIKVLGSIPTTQTKFTDARFLRIANNVMRSRMVPLLLAIDESYFTYHIEGAVNATGIYNLSARAVAAKLINVAILNGDERRDCTWYNEDELMNYDAAFGEQGFYIRRNQLFLVPRVPTSGSTLQQVIMLRPGEIIDPDDAAQITAINTSTGVVTCSTVPSTWTTSNTFEMTQAEPHFDTLGFGLAISAITTGASGTLTFAAADLNSRLAVGDWIALSGKTPIIQLPVEMQPLFAQRCTNVCLKSQTDLEAYKAGVEEAKELEEIAINMLRQRVQHEQKKIVNLTGITRRGLS